MASGGSAHRFPDAWYDGAPSWVLDARKDIGLREALRGKKSNPAVLKFFADCGHGWVTDCIGTPWCAAYFGAKVVAGGMPSTRNLMARSYLKWGEPRRGKPQIGDAAVFWRGRRDDGITGHIGIFIRADDRQVYVLSGNSGDQVAEEAVPIRKLLGFRKPPAPVVIKDSDATASEPPPVPLVPPAPPAVPAMAWQTSVVRELAPVSRKVSLLARVRLTLNALGASIIGLFSLETLGVAREWIEQVTALVRGNAPFILVAAAVCGVVLATYLISCIGDDHKAGRYVPSGTPPDPQPV